MKKKLLALGFWLINLPVMANNNLPVAKADKAYTANNLVQLSKLYQAYPTDITINYLYSKAMLSKNNSTYAVNFVTQFPNSYMRSDLLHKLLIFYFTNNSLTNYKRTFTILPLAQTSINEKCGYDLANIVLSVSSKPLLSNEWLISNRIPSWCANLIATRYNRGRLDEDQRNLMLYNLLADGKTDVFNHVAPSVGLAAINFARYSNVVVDDLPANENYNYLVVNRIVNIAKKDPTRADREIKQASLDANTRIYLTNYLAMQFAIKQKFDQAELLYKKSANSYLSNEEYEWQARTYLYFSNWNKVITSIDHMPEALKNKNTWLYWKAKAYENLNQADKASKLFAQIPHEFSYYSLLAQAELESHTQLKATPLQQVSLGKSKLLSQAKMALALYEIGKSIPSMNLINLATAQWNYIARNADNSQLAAMSKLAYRKHFYDLSIYAATQMSDRYLDLSFPMPFSSYYNKYSTLFGIDPSYALAVSRQESRFNYAVIAFDGGVGLMQIMPQTAAYITYKSGFANCYKMGPECNIKFGTWYLGSLYGKFNNNLIYSTAAYNAGPTRSKRWQDQLGSLDNKIQIELIPISVTRDYVQKVLTNKAIYDGKLAQRRQIDLLKYVNTLTKNYYLNQADDDNTDAKKIKYSNN